MLQMMHSGSGGTFHTTAKMIPSSRVGSPPEYWRCLLPLLSRIHQERVDLYVLQLAKRRRKQTKRHTEREKERERDITLFQPHAG